MPSVFDSFTRVARTSRVALTLASVCAAAALLPASASATALGAVTDLPSGTAWYSIVSGPDGALWMLEDANPGGLYRVTPK